MRGIRIVTEPIDSRQLHIFIALARKGSLRAAAAELYLTNSAISHSIRSLETSLDTKLFHRPGKFLELTEKGHFLLKEASNILSSMDRVRRQLTGDDTAQRTPLRVAVGFNFLSHLLPEIVREWQGCFPQGNIVARAAERDVCLKLVNENEADMAVLVDPPEDAVLKVEPLFEDELRVVVAAGNPLATSESVSLRSLHGKTLLVSRMQSHTTQMVLSEMRRNRFSFHDCIELGSTEAIHEMVKVGEGIALQPDWVMDRRSEDKGLVSRPLNQIRIIRRWALVSLSDKENNLMERTFLRLCRRVAENVCGYAFIVCLSAQVAFFESSLGDIFAD